MSAIQREREEMLAIYESPNNLPVPLFGKLAGKSKDQINRELKAGKLLSISLGNRGSVFPIGNWCRSSTSWLWCS